MLFSCVQLATKFGGVASAPNMPTDRPFRCRVMLEGPSVLEGIRQMVEAGIADAPLPSYVADVKTGHRNKFLIRTKATLPESSQQASR